MSDKCRGCGGDAADNYFDRSLCPEPCGMMHTCCRACDATLDECYFESKYFDDLARPEGRAT